MDTVINYGVLGGVVGASVEKLDLKKMIEELDLYEVQFVFIYPISLESMQDHVTFCMAKPMRGANIFKWSSLG